MHTNNCSRLLYVCCATNLCWYPHLYFIFYIIDLIITFNLGQLLALYFCFGCIFLCLVLLNTCLSFNLQDIIAMIIGFPRGTECSKRFPTPIVDDVVVALMEFTVFHFKHSTSYLITSTDLIVINRALFRGTSLLILSFVTNIPFYLWDNNT